jgi:hypothetical protein
MLLDLIMVGPISIRRRPEAEVRGPIHCQLKLPEEKAQGGMGHTFAHSSQIDGNGNAKNNHFY